jgi:hypothetical protein
MTPETLSDVRTLIEKHFAPFSVMLAFGNKSNLKPAGIGPNGTGSLINTGLQNILITNYHVYAGLETRRADSPETVLLMSGVNNCDFVDISETPVVALSETYDLVVLSIPDQVVFHQGKRFRAEPSWPPCRAASGMRAYLFGYPGRGRRPRGNKLELGTALIVTFVHSVREDHFVLVDDNCEVATFCPQGVTALTGYGGMSGSAVYVETGTDQFKLAGFMYEASTSRNIIYARHADQINADGTIRDQAF